MAVIHLIRPDGVTQLEQALPGGGEFMVDLDDPVTVSRIMIHVEMPVPAVPEAGEDDDEDYDTPEWDE
jgi:hypothetical protein